MAILINGHQLTKTFASRNLFRNISFSIEDGERVGLIGPNGAGKSTLLKILAREMEPDDGSLSSRRGLRVGYLAQVPVFKPESTVISTLLEGADPAHIDDWETMARADEIMSRLGLSGTAGQNEELGVVFTGDTLVKELSGGWKKRVALARELMKDPDLLLLDEPTNHLDLESILWLEDFVSQSKFATLIITHDRVFLQKISNRIIELDRRHPDGLLSVKGSYADFLEGRAILLAGQAAAEVRMRNTLRRETEWLRRGAKARTTKQTARINRQEDLVSAVDEIAERNRSSVANLDFKSFEKNPKKLIEAKGISKKYGERIIVPPLDLLISPKTRIGLLGANGCGKSTLIRLLLHREQPDSGTIIHADRLRVAYFEQNRESLDPTLSLQKTVCPEGDFVDFAGAHIHVKSYLQRFLFSYEQMDLPVGRLSGGEQARLLIARLMLRPANVLVLDEPTNDLDMETLDVLQDVLAEFDGAVVLVSHDRYFLDQVCTRLLAFGVDGHGEKKLVTFADIEQWEQWHALQDQLRAINEAAPSKKSAAKGDSKSEAKGGEKSEAKGGEKSGVRTGETSGDKRKLSYKDQRDLDMMDVNIQKAEAALAALTEESLNPEVISNAKRLTEIVQKMANAQAEVDRLYARWHELETPKN